MFSFISRLFSHNPVSSYGSFIARVGELESSYEKISNDALRAESESLRTYIPEHPDDMSVIAKGFALAREAAKRTLNQRHFDVQLMGGFAMYEGKIAEMATGEGKTLAATAPAYVRALMSPSRGGGVHVITVNDYLALRDTVWMGQVYALLGMKTACLVHDSAYIYDAGYVAAKQEEDSQHADAERDAEGSFKVHREFLRPISRKEAYMADIVYGTNHEFGFDYLRDNLAYTTSGQVQRGHYFAIIDEVDSILIDEARTPLIISAPDVQSAEHYKVFARIVSQLEKDSDYEVDEKTHFVSITQSGIEKVETALQIDNLYDGQYVRLVHYLEESLKARALFHRDKNYIVKDGQIIIVDEFTGRLMHGRRYSGGLHQAIEAKEGVPVQEESKTYAQITIQNYFRLYEKISGMTGTAFTSAEEFQKVYNLDVVQIPTNKPRMRDDHPDLIFKTKDAKYEAIISRVKSCVEKGQPVLVGTTSIDENEYLSSRFSGTGIVHETLNAKNHEREGEIIAQAGRPGKVMLATNMAGRGVDIVLGGNPSDPIEAKRVRDAGGLFVLGTQRNDARRVDNQLRGRSGRQGDPGETQFFISLEDDMMRIFGGDRIKALMNNMKMPDDVPIESNLVVRVINEAQKKVEGFNFDARKHLLDYDDVLNKQRTAIYRKRQHMLEEIEKGSAGELLSNMLLHSIKRVMQTHGSQDPYEESHARDHVESYLKKMGFLGESGTLSEDDFALLEDEHVFQAMQERIASKAADAQTALRMLAALDMFWTNHLENLEALLESVRMRAYGQKDPLVEYKKESYDLFKNLISDVEEWVLAHVFQEEQKIAVPTARLRQNISSSPPSIVSKKEVNPNTGDRIGRNDPCWCGSGKKYKKCHGR